MSINVSGRQLLEDAANAMKLSARGFHRVLKVARTLADMQIPNGYADLFNSIPADLFRLDISSSQLRAAKQRGSR